ncbi:MAG TPA: 5'/3'-nucleotidase SurE [Sphaerochaeta sp.]|nr:5'/3'-nucleotidase SurE [Sphaerochaeta sp.]HQB54196.1 5'/3'-nucleotidase SurE [Sphaerochaeta sp.]
MKILLTNDDGYKSEGLNTLADVLAAAGHEIWICAPTLERSASSHAMTLRGDITITEYEPNRYHCSGTPADCILYASRVGLFGEKPDVVISGINHGYNISTDVLYSGTVAAAREAAINGMKAIAISASKDENGKFAFTESSVFVRDNLLFFMNLVDESTIISINVPPRPNGKVRPSNLAYLDYHDAVATKKSEEVRVVDPSSVRFGTSVILKLKGGAGPTQRCSTQESDFQTVKDGYISVTALDVLPSINSAVQTKLASLGGG